MQLYAGGAETISQILLPVVYAAFERRITGQTEIPAVALPIDTHNRLIFIPINVNNNHWVLGWISLTTQEMGILSSMRNFSDTQPLRHLLMENGINADDFR